MVLRLDFSKKILIVKIAQNMKNKYKSKIWILGKLLFFCNISLGLFRLDLLKVQLWKCSIYIVSKYGLKWSFVTNRFPGKVLFFQLDPRIELVCCSCRSWILDYITLAWFWLNTPNLEPKPPDYLGMALKRLEIVMFLKFIFNHLSSLKWLP